MARGRMGRGQLGSWAEGWGGEEWGGDSWAAGQKDGDGDTADHDGPCSTQPEAPDASTSDGEAVSPPEKQQKTRQAR